MIENLASDVHAFTSNAFLVTGERTVLVDTGANFDVVSRLGDHDELDAIVVTHTHDDHVGNLDAVKSAAGVDAWGYDTTVDGIDHALDHGDHVTLGDHTYEAWHTPGHKADHLCLYAAEPEILFSGDLIFQNGSYGRTDLPEGDHEALVLSIHDVLDAIEESLSAMYPGHGPGVTQSPYKHVEAAARHALATQ